MIYIIILLWYDNMVYAVLSVFWPESSHPLGRLMTTGPLEIEVSFDGSLNALIITVMYNVNIIIDKP